MALESVSSEFTIDWVNATMSVESASTVGSRLLVGKRIEKIDPPMPRGYNAGILYESGAFLVWNTGREDMGVMLTLSGSALRWMYARGENWKALLIKLKEMSARTSRIDLAIDIRNSSILLSDMGEESLKPYKGKGRTPNYLPVGTQKKGWTVYVGARTSEKFLRIYDKSLEQKDGSVGWIRIELELKGMAAHAVGWEFPSMAECDCVGMAQGLMGAVADFKHEDYQFALRSRVVGFGIPKKPKSDTLKWLTETVAKTLARQVAKTPDEPILEQFWDGVREELTRLGIDYI